MKRSIKFKEKIFRGENWTPVVPFPEIKEWEDRKDHVIVDINDNIKSYLDDYRKVGQYSIIRKRIKDLRKDIKNLHFYDEEFAKDSNTHWIGDQKDLKKKHYMSKDIDNHNRLTFDLYRPIVFMDNETGEKYLMIKVNLIFCEGHKDRDTRKLYTYVEKGK